MLRMILHFSHERAQMHYKSSRVVKGKVYYFNNQCRVIDRQTGTQIGHLQKNVLEVLYSYILQTHTQSYDYAEVQR